VEGGTDEAVEAALRDAELVHELAPLVGGEALQLGLEVGVDRNALEPRLTGAELANRRAVAVAGDVGDVEHRLAGQQAGGVELPPLVGGQAGGAQRRPAFENLPIAEQALALGGVLVGMGPPVLVALGDRAIEHLEVGEHELGLDDLRVALRVDAGEDVGHLAAWEAADHVGDGVDLADLAEKLVAEPFPLLAPLTRPAMSMKRIAHGVTLPGDRERASASRRGSGTATTPTLLEMVVNG